MKNRRDAVSTIDLVRALSSNLDVTLSDSRRVVDFLFDYILEKLYEEGKDVVITGKIKFHVFIVQSYKIYNKNGTNEVPMQYKVALKRSTRRYFKKARNRKL